MHDDLMRWLLNARQVATQDEVGSKVLETFGMVLARIHGEQWRGACHATAAALFVVLSEQGVQSELRLGVAKVNGRLFDHSWVEVDAHPYDAAISLPCEPTLATAPPVFAGLDLSTFCPTAVFYDAASDEGFDEDGRFIQQASLEDYARVTQNVIGGFWGMCSTFVSRLGPPVGEETLRRRYGKTRWQLVRPDLADS